MSNSKSVLQPKVKEMVCEAQGCFNKANKEIRIPIGTVGEISVSVCNNGKQEFYYPYCFKIIIAERSPDETKAKGVLDRTFVFNTYHGKPKYDVKEILKPAGDIKRQSLLNELIDFRKLLLIYRLSRSNSRHRHRIGG